MDPRECLKLMSEEEIQAKKINREIDKLIKKEKKVRYMADLNFKSVSISER